MSRVKQMALRLVLSLAAGATGGLSASAEERDTPGQAARGAWFLPAAIRPTLDTDGYRLYTLGFEPETDDRDLNRRPDTDRWERVRGKGYPFYCRCVLDTDRPHWGRNALRLEPDGASVALRTLPLPVSRFHTYEVTGWIRTRGLVHAETRIALEWLAEDGRTVLAHGHAGASSVREQVPPKAASPAQVREPLQEVVGQDRSAPLGGTADWRTCRFVAQPPQDLALRWMRLRLGVEAGPSGSDIHAAAWFDSITIREQPHPALRTSEPANLFLSHQRKSVTLLLSGLKAKHAPARLILTDIHGREVLATEAPLARLGVPVPATPPREELVHGQRNRQHGRAPAPLAAEAEKTTVCRFAFDLKRPGLYRATVTVGSPASPLVTRHVWLAIAPREDRGYKPSVGAPGPPEAHTLGLTLGPGPTPHGLTKLLNRIGCRLVKMPIQSVPGADSPDALIRELAEQGTTCVGVLTGRGVLDSADTVGREQLALTIAQYGGRIAAWQVGDDADRSLCEAPDLARLLKHLAESAGPLVKDLPLVAAWSALYRRPTAAAGLRAVNIDIGPEVPPETIPFQVGSDGAPFWATIHPLDRSLFGREARLRDLVLRVVYARQAGARRVFLAPLVDNRFGLLREDGSPTETLLAWRTLTEMLDGLPCLGQAPLPGGTPNALFGTGPQAVLVVWSPDGQRTERLSTSAGAEQIDLLGRRQPLTTIDGETAVTVGPMPVFVTGVDAGLAATCASLRLGPGQPSDSTPVHLESAYRWHVRTVRFTNRFDRSIRGWLSLSPGAGARPHRRFRIDSRTRSQGSAASTATPTPARGATGGLSASSREQDTGGQAARGTRADPGEGWRIEPKVMPFELAPGADFERRVRILFPYSTPCGTRMLHARWRIETDRRLQASTEVPVRIGLTGIAMRADVLRTPDGNAVLRLRLENSGSHRLRVSCYVTVAGVETVRSGIFQVPAGDQVQRRYVLGQAEDLAGQTVRIGLRELGGTRFLNRGVTIPARAPEWTALEPADVERPTPAAEAPHASGPAPHQ